MVSGNFTPAFPGMVGRYLAVKCTNLLRYKRHILRPRGIQRPTRMAPIQSRSMRYLMVYCQRDPKGGSNRLLLQSGCRFCLLLLERSMFQHLQSKVQHGSAKYTVLHPRFHHETGRFLQWSRNSLCLGLSLIHISEPTRPY